MLLAFVIAAGLAIPGEWCSISGTVMDERGSPVPGAAVFLEQGIEGPVQTTRADQSGDYRFDEVAPGVVGVFARQDGYAWGGSSVSLGLGQSADNVDLRLRAPGKLSGRAMAGKSGVQGVRVTRVALLTESPVSVPFSKLRGFGISEPVTDSNGEYTIDGLPTGATVAVKLAHPSFAQARIDEARVGSTTADVALFEGVLVSGRVLAAGTQRPVAEAVVSIRNANPPHDTAIAVTDGQGNFGVRLLPGAYMYKAGGAQFESAGWRALELTGQVPVKQLSLVVAGTGEIRGKVLDAKSGGAIEGARLFLSTSGAPAEMARTGPTGEYKINVMAGENTIRIEPAPGYLPPTTPGTQFVIKEGESLELPAFWLAPLPRYTLSVVNENEEPVPGAVIRLLRPAQFGWQIADGEGVVRLEFLNLPRDGRVVGLVEHPTQETAAMFSIGPENSENAVVELMPLAKASGRVVNESGQPIEGAVVDGRLLDESFDDPILIWRTVTNASGEYNAPIVPAQVAHIVAAYTVNEWGVMDAQGSPETFVATEATNVPVPDISLNTSSGGKSLFGERLRWASGRHHCGPASPGNRDAGAAIVQYCRATEAEAAIAGLEAVAEIFGDRFRYAVIVDGEIECSADRVHVFVGKAPATASTYVIDEAGEVVLETFGLPPLRALRGR